MDPDRSGLRLPHHIPGDFQRAPLSLLRQSGAPAAKTSLPAGWRPQKKPHASASFGCQRCKGRYCASALLQHTTRTFHNLQGQVESKDSGLWINSFDYTGIQHITPHVPEINDSFRTHCREDRPFCGFPWFLPVKFLSKSVTHLLFLVTLGAVRTASPPCSFRKNWYLPAPEVSPSSPVDFRLLSKEETSWGTIKMTFRVTG